MEERGNMSYDERFDYAHEEERSIPFYQNLGNALYELITSLFHSRSKPSKLENMEKNVR